MTKLNKVFRGFGFAVLGIFSMAVTGCINFDEEDERGEQTGHTEVTDGQVVINLRLPGDFVTPRNRTRMSVAGESEVVALRVFMFDAHDRLLSIERGFSRGSNSFSVALPAAPEGTQVKMVLMANADDIIASSVGFDTASPAFPSRDYAVLMPLISSTVTGPMFAAADSRIPMWGESGYVEVRQGYQEATVSLMRSVARVDVGIGKYTKAADGTYSWNGLTGADDDPNSRPIPFEMTAVYVVRPNSGFSVAPTPSNIDPSGAYGNPTAINPSVPAGTVQFDTFLDATAEDLFRFDVAPGTNYTTREIYIPEADIRTGGKNNHRGRMALVVAGRYAGESAESYYRVDFGEGDHLSDVLRNHLYMFSIANVVGRGYPSVETAYNSQAMNMTVDVLDWDQAIINNIWFEGSSYFAIDRQTLMFGPLPGETLSMNINTNIPDFEFYYSDDPVETIRFSSSNRGPFDGSQRFGYVYTLVKREPTTMADDHYVLEVYNPRDNVGEQPDPAGRRADWTVRALNLRMNFHVDQKWSNGETSLQDRQGAYLTPEGTDGRAIPIEIISLYPAEITATDGNGQPAAWIDLGDTGNLTSSGADYFHYKHDLVIPPFRYGAGRDGTTDRTATITIYIPQTGKRVDYTITQQAPYVRIDRESVSAPRPAGGSGTATVPVYVYTNVKVEHLQVVQTTGDQNFIRLLNGGALVDYDPRNPGNRRFDVGVVYDPAVTDAYGATFTVSDSGGFYGDLPDAKVDVVVPPANRIFDAYWRGAAFAGSGIGSGSWAPAQMTLPVGGSNYVFPWNATSIALDAVSNIGHAPDPANMAQSDIDRMTIAGPVAGQNGAMNYRYNYSPGKSSYSAVSTHKLAFTSTLKPDLLKTDVTFRLGAQVLKVDQNAYSDNRFDWNGRAQSNPAVVDVTGNVGWSARVETAHADGNWLRVRAANDIGTSTGAGFAAGFAEMDDRLYAPQELPAGQNYESNTTTMLVNDTELQMTVDPLDFYVPFDSAQPESRTATITIHNNDHDPQRLGASDPAPISITQWNRILRSEGSDMPAYSLLQPEDVNGRSYSFMARTNLDSWRVDIWEADADGVRTGTAPLATSRYSGSPSLSASAAPLVSLISGVSLPEAGFVRRNLLIMLSADGLTEGQEQLVGLWNQPGSNPHPGLPYTTNKGIPAPPGVLGVGAETGRLTLRGSKEYPNSMAVAAGVGSVATETVYVVLFKRGSLVGLSSNTDRTGYNAEIDIVWAAGAYDVETFIAGGGAWAGIPSVAAAQAWPTMQNASAGRGDPCGFADGYDDGSGPWKTPTGRTTPGAGSWDSPNAGSINGREQWQIPVPLQGRQLLADPVVNGWSFTADGAVVIPFAGYRDAAGTYTFATNTWISDGQATFWINGGTGNVGMRIIGNLNGNAGFSVAALTDGSASPIRCVPK